MPANDLHIRIDHDRDEMTIAEEVLDISEPATVTIGGESFKIAGPITFTHLFYSGLIIRPHSDGQPSHP
jgi:hypothetical protein